jgi:hypothetical protein
MLHSAVFHYLPPDLAALAGESGHVTLSDFLAARPQFVGKNVWDPATFNPTNSDNPKDWLYDAHFIEDDRPIEEQTGVLEPGGVASLADSLPDMLPLQSWSGGSFSPFIDTTEQPGRVLYKFANGIGNMGAGPASLFSASSGTPPAGSGITSWVNPDGTQNVLQRIYSYNPATNSFSFSRYAPGGTFIYHAGHGHFHLEGYAEYKLVQNVGGVPGNQVMRNDGTEAVGEKVGFCLINVSTFAVPGSGQSSTSLPGYSANNSNGQPSPSCGFTQGVSVGRADVYNSGYDGQWIDVTGVPNGSYFIQVTADSKNAVEESDESNNTMYVPVTLNVNPPSGGISPDRFETPIANNTFGNATNLGELGVSTEAGLTAHAGVDFDYFRFTAASSGSYNVQLAFTNGNMDLYVYDSAQNLLEQATTPADSTGSQLLETVSINFTAGQSYYVMARGALISGASYEGTSNNYSLRTFINPTVSPSTPDAAAGENNNPGRIAITRNGPFSSPLTVPFTTGGNAQRGVDYNIYKDGVLIPTTVNQVIIDVESLTANLDIVPVADGALETNETVSLTVSSSSAYVLGAGGAQLVTINDTAPQVSQTVQTWQTSPHKLAFQFTLDVAPSLTVDDLLIESIGSEGTIVPDTFVYDPGTKIATATFAGVLPDGRYRATLTGSGITHALGVPMDSDYQHEFFVLTADANHDGAVNSDDFNLLASNFGTTGKDGSQGDFDYDSDVDSDDFNILAGKFGTVLKSPSITTRAGVLVGKRATGAGTFSAARAIEPTSDALRDLLV